MQAHPNGGTGRCPDAPAKGWSLRWWIENLTAPGARFVGFDSFEGLPEGWRPDYPPGTFNVDGMPPPIPDLRVSFEVGFFEETLAGFAMPDHDGSL